MQGRWARHPRCVRHSIYAAGMAAEDPPVATRPSRADSTLAHAEGSITEDAVLAAARERAEDSGAGSGDTGRRCAAEHADPALRRQGRRGSGHRRRGERSVGALSGMRDDGVLTTIDIEPTSAPGQAGFQRGRHRTVAHPAHHRARPGGAHPVGRRVLRTWCSSTPTRPIRPTSCSRGSGCCGPAGSSSCTTPRSAAAPGIRR